MSPIGPRPVDDHSSQAAYDIADWCERHAVRFSEAGRLVDAAAWLDRARWWRGKGGARDRRLPVTL